tara:strand:+ start:1140 stop:1778 length:639 start_codon:yes stop_codon:yes gene_type:complete
MGKLFKNFLNYDMSGEAKGKMGNIANKASKIETELESDFKGIRSQMQKRKAEEILENINSRENKQATAKEQKKLKRLRSNYDKSVARQERKNKRLDDAGARLELKKQSYVNKMTRKGIMSEGQAISHFENMRGITKNSAERTQAMLNMQNKELPLPTEKEKLVKNEEEEINSEAIDIVDEQASSPGFTPVDTNSDIGNALLTQKMTGILGKK